MVHNGQLFYLPVSSHRTEMQEGLSSALRGQAPCDLWFAHFSDSVFFSVHLCAFPAHVGHHNKFQRDKFTDKPWRTICQGLQRYGQCFVTMAAYIALLL